MMKASEWAQREAVVVEALSWLNTPYRHMGRVKGAGVDCGMLLLEVFEKAGVIPRVDMTEYPSDWHLHRSEERYLSNVMKYAVQIPGPPMPGDIVLYRFGRCFSHGGIVIDWPRIVHSYLGIGVLLDDANANQALVTREPTFWTCWGGGS